MHIRNMLNKTLVYYTMDVYYLTENKSWYMIIMKYSDKGYNEDFIKIMTKYGIVI